MDFAISAVGVFAAICTTISYFPQVKKAYETNSVEDLSLKMILFLITGLCAWVVYGILKGDIIIIGANTISVMCLLSILVVKIKES